MEVVEREKNYQQEGGKVRAGLCGGIFGVSAVIGRDSSGY